MRVGRFLMAAFCLASTITGPQSFAVGTDGLQTHNKNKVVALVRFENNEAKCVQYTSRVQAEKSASALPLCNMNGVEGDQNQAAMDTAIAGGQRTAFLSHVGMALFGCAVGVGGALAGASMENMIRDDASSVGAGAGVATAIGAGRYAILLLSSDPTGHLIAGVSGALVCGGGITYLFYSNRFPKQFL